MAPASAKRVDDGGVDLGNQRVRDRIARPGRLDVSTPLDRATSPAGVALGWGLAFMRVQLFTVVNYA